MIEFPTLSILFPSPFDEPSLGERRNKGGKREGGPTENTIHQVCVPRLQGGGTGARPGVLFVPLGPAAGKQTREEAGAGLPASGSFLKMCIFFMLGDVMTKALL